MHERPEDLSEDYAYDLAHERTGARGTAPQQPLSEHPGPAPAHPEVEPGSDMGYDEAHDF